MNIRLLLAGCLSIMWMVSSCVSNVEEELYPPDNCDTAQVTFMLTVVPILELQCYECHSGDEPISNIPLDNYEGVKKKADDGTLIGAIRHRENFSPMPENSPALPECDIQKMERWVANGAPDN
jgi:Planctomycete cytochrome C